MSNFAFFLVVAGLTVFVGLGIYVFLQYQNVLALKSSVSTLEKTVSEMDNQAKIILKSDMELKVYQEEVEDKLDKLTFLKNLIISSVTLMDREDLYTQINEKVVNDLGFKKSLLFNYETLDQRLNVGCTPQEEAAIKDFLLHKKQVLASTYLLSYESEPCSKLTYTLGYNDYLIAPIRGHDTVHGVFFVGSMITPTAIRTAEREIFSIVCMYLGQCLDNIKLFEDLYRSKDELEKKIRERTNELVKTLKEMEGVSKAKSDFISSVSHELRTPLTSVKGFSSLLVAEKFGALPPEAKARLEKIDQNVNRLVEMVNMLLDISRIESGKTEVKIAPTDIIKLIKDASDFLSPQMQAKKIAFETNLPGELVVLMDKNLIERVLTNLISNSLKFTPDGGKIKVACVKDGEHAKISIADTGCGIPKEDMGKLFSEFYRSQLTKTMPGTGLGLSLVKRIIETHKEKIWVESEVGQGTTFYFTLKLGDKNSNV